MIQQGQGFRIYYQIGGPGIFSLTINEMNVNSKYDAVEFAIDNDKLPEDALILKTDKIYA